MLFWSFRTLRLPLLPEKWEMCSTSKKKSRLAFHTNSLPICCVHISEAHIVKFSVLPREWVWPYGCHFSSRRSRFLFSQRLELWKWNATHPLLLSPTGRLGIASSCCTASSPKGLSPLCSVPRQARWNMDKSRAVLVNFRPLALASSALKCPTLLQRGILEKMFTVAEIKLAKWNSHHNSSYSKSNIVITSVKQFINEIPVPT